MAFGREDYERQGAQVLSSGAEFRCSSDSVIKAVIMMARNNSHRFTSILDVGCGADPSYTCEIAAMDKQVHGLDYTFNFLRLAQPRSGNVRLAQADATQMPYRDCTFDAAICSETAEHLPDDLRVLREIARVLKPHGLLFFTVPNLWNASRIVSMIKTRDFTVRLAEHRIGEYSPRQVRRLLSPSSMIERSYPVGFGWKGLLGTIERTVNVGLLRRFSSSIAAVARKAH
jgi:ubiquinone/menaquinone biosynthesis C-methylase UbiE